MRTQRCVLLATIAFASTLRLMKEIFLTIAAVLILSLVITTNTNRLAKELSRKPVVETIPEETDVDIERQLSDLSTFGQTLAGVLDIVKNDQDAKANKMAEQFTNTKLTVIHSHKLINVDFQKQPSIVSPIVGRLLINDLETTISKSPMPVIETNQIEIVTKVVRGKWVFLSGKSKIISVNVGPDNVEFRLNLGNEELLSKSFGEEIFTLCQQK